MTTTSPSRDMRPTLPVWFGLLARLLPLGIFAQFLSAGLGLFLDRQLLGLHGAVGSALSLPVIALFAGTFLAPALRGLRRWTAVVLALYLIQVALAAGAAPLPLSLHPANGALLLAASLLLLSKVEQRRGEPAS